MRPVRSRASVADVKPISSRSTQTAAGTGSAPTVVVRDLRKRYRDVLALDSVDFTLTAGSITGFLGANGAGKTTTLRVLLGLSRPTSGEAFVFGRPYRDLPDPTRRVGALLESDDFDPGRTGRNHLRALALATGVGFDRADEVVELVDLDRAADRRVGGYSLGMRQRLGLAGAMLGDPELLILDEPANGLDAAGVRWLRGFLRHFATSGGTVLMSSHLLAEVAQTVDQVMIISHGRLAATVSMADLDGGTALEDYYLHLTGGNGQ